MRQEVIELGELGPLPLSSKVIRENLQELADKYEKLIICQLRSQSRTKKREFS